MTLYLESTEDSPKVLLDAKSGRMLIEGRSFMEDAAPFHQAIEDWMRSYFKNPAAKTTMMIELDYINTSSTKMLADLLFEMNKFYIFGNDVVIKWRYHHQDEDIEELGKELKEMVDMPFEFGVLV